ncbi:MAG: hypothetical protein ACYCVH_14640 [Ignavibacteriaceae bacterium]
METLLVKINEPQKTNYLIQVLKSLDFVASVDYFDSFTKAKTLFNEVNQVASTTELPDLTTDEIIAEIKDYRREKKSHSN